MASGPKVPRREVTEVTRVRVGRAASGCPVCGFSEVRADEVVHGGVVFLGLCPRCDHRWTSTVPGPTVALRARAPRELTETPAAA
jgi:hypothetical protein